MKKTIILLIVFLLMSNVPDLYASGKKAKISKEQIIGTWYDSRNPDLIHRFYEDGSTFDEGPNIRNTSPLCWEFKKPNIILIKHVIDSDSCSCTGNFFVKITIVRMMSGYMIINISYHFSPTPRDGWSLPPKTRKNVKFIKRK